MYYNSWEFIKTFKIRGTTYNLSLYTKNNKKYGVKQSCIL